MPPSTEALEASDRTRIHHPPVPSSVRWALRCLVLVVAVGAPVAAFAGEREVSLDVEGAVRTVRTYAGDARDLLVRTGYVPASTDLVAPSGAIDEGDRVTFRRAKKVDVVLDGERKTVTARGLTVGDALKDLGLVPGPEDHLTPARDTRLSPGLEIFVRNAVATKLRADGRVRDVVTSADSVRGLLAHAGVEVGRDDHVIPSLDAVPSDGMWVRVVRVRKAVEEKRINVPFRTVTRNDPELPSGERRIVQQGAEGLKVQRFSVVREDGVVVSNRLLGETVLRPSRDHIVRVGTKQPTYQGSSTAGGKESGIASWFAADGLVAAHRTLPIGTVVKVTAENGKTVTVRINQRGPFVEGRIIDLSDDAFERLAPLGQGTIRVTIES